MYILSVGATDVNFQQGGAGIPISVENWTEYGVTMTGGSSLTPICIGPLAIPLPPSDPVGTAFELWVSNEELTDGLATYRETLIPAETFSAPITYSYLLGDTGGTVMELADDVEGRLYTNDEGDVDVSSETWKEAQGSPPDGAPYVSEITYTVGDLDTDPAGSYVATTPLNLLITSYRLCEGFNCLEGEPAGPPPVINPAVHPVQSLLSMATYATTETSINSILGSDVKGAGAGAWVNCNRFGDTESAYPGHLAVTYDSGPLTGVTMDLTTTPGTGTWVTTYSWLGTMSDKGWLDLAVEQTWIMELTELGP